jgi:hypothetical protein
MGHRIDGGLNEVVNDPVHDVRVEADGVKLLPYCAGYLGARWDRRAFEDMLDE